MLCNFKVRHVFFCKQAKNQKALKIHLLIISFILSIAVKAQKIDSIFVNLYTDSLKKGTYNYINVDGLSDTGRYFPLDTTQLTFAASAGTFDGNSLWVEPDFKGKRISFKVVLKSNPAIVKQFEMCIKQLPDGPLKTEAEVLQEMRKRKGKGK